MSCTTPLLLCTTKYYSSTTLFYKVLLQYYSVLQSTTPILLCTTPVLPCTTPVQTCTTKYYSSTNLYYKVVIQYYPVLQSTTPILLRTTKYYSNTTPYYKYYSVLLQYYPVLQSTTQALLRTTPVLPCTTKYYSSITLYYKVLHDWSASHMKRPLQCAEQQKAASNFSKYCACQAKWISWLIRIAYETSITMRRATGITLQLHQILRLPRKMNLMIDPHHLWNVIYNAGTNKQQASNSNLTKYCACHAKCISWLIGITYETSFTMREPTSINLQPHQILRLPRKMNLMIDPHYYETSFTKSGATGISLQPHQILRLPPKRYVMIDPHHIWNVIYNARSDRHHPATSPNTARATQNCTPKS